MPTNARCVPKHVHVHGIHTNARYRHKHMQGAHTAITCKQASAVWNLSTSLMCEHHPSWCIMMRMKLVRMVTQAAWDRHPPECIWLTTSSMPVLASHTCHRLGSWHGPSKICTGPATGLMTVTVSSLPLLCHHPYSCMQTCASITSSIASWHIAVLHCTHHTTCQHIV